MNYTFEKLRDIIECFDPCMDNYLYVYDIIQDLYFISERAQKRFALSSNYSETILSGQPKKRRLPPHIFQAFYLAQPKGLCGNYRHFPAKRF